MAESLTTIQMQVATPVDAILLAAPINTNISGDNVIIPAVVGQVIRVFKIFAVASSSVQVTPIDGTPSGTAFTGPLTLGSFALDFDSQPWFTTSSGKAFVLNLSTGVQVSGSVFYTQG